MKEHILPAIKLTLFTTILFCGIYTLLIYAVAQFAPAKGKGQTVTVNGKIVGYALEGQTFNQDKYFWSRPSAINYNAASSGGSNKGPGNPDYLKDVQNKVDSFIVHNPTIQKEQIPSDMLNASGSGLDPDISLQAALIQVDRISKLRNINKEKIESIIQSQKEKSFTGIERLNVLQLNIALDTIK